MKAKQSPRAIDFSSALKDNENSNLINMQEFEELFYIYLSIVAIIPSKRQEFLSILDVFG